MGSVELKNDWTALGIDMRRHVFDRRDDETVSGLFKLRKENRCQLEEGFEDAKHVCSKRGEESCGEKASIALNSRKPKSIVM